MVLQKKRIILEGKVSYSLFDCGKEYYLSIKEERAGKEPSSGEFCLPACSETEALSFVSALIENAGSSSVLENLIQDSFG